MAVRIAVRPYPQGFDPSSDRWHMKSKSHQDLDYHLGYPWVMHAYQVYYGLFGLVISLGSIPFGGSFTVGGRSGHFEMHGELTAVNPQSKMMLESAMEHIEATARTVSELNGIDKFEITFVQEVKPKER